MAQEEESEGFVTRQLKWYTLELGTLIMLLRSPALLDLLANAESTASLAGGLTGAVLGAYLGSFLLLSTVKVIGIGLRRGISAVKAGVRTE